MTIEPKLMTAEYLAEALRIVAQDASGRWRYPEPVREFHPFWCCPHLKRAHHDSLCRGCAPLDVAAQPGFGRVVWRVAKHEYDHERDFRVDFAYPQHKVAIECEGVTYAAAGRHQTGAGFSKELEKYTALRLAGWDVIRIGQRQITSGEALTLIEKALAERKASGVS